MRHTEVKMDRSQSTTPSELDWRSRQSVILSRMPLSEDATLSLQASAFSDLQAQSLSFDRLCLFIQDPNDWFRQAQEGSLC